MANLDFRGLFGAYAVTAHVYYAGFGLGLGRYDVLDDVANHVEGRVGHRLGLFFRVVAEDEPSYGVDAGFGGD